MPVVVDVVVVVVVVVAVVVVNDYGRAIVACVFKQ